jgi:hypothetical protein
MSADEAVVNSGDDDDSGSFVDKDFPGGGHEGS